MPHEERVKYETLKSWMLEAYFEFCRDRGVISGRPHAEILGGISYEYETCLERPVEQLMREAIHVILNGGWYKQPMTYHCAQIHRIIKQHGLNSLLLEVPKEEADIFRNDLRILKII